MKINLTEKTKYTIKGTSAFNNSLKKVFKQGKDINKLKNVVKKLANNEELESKYKNHKLKDNKYYQDCLECHIEPDWLLVYKYNDDELILLLVNTGSHSEILNI